MEKVLTLLMSFSSKQKHFAADVRRGRGCSREAAGEAHATLEPQHINTSINSAP